MQMNAWADRHAVAWRVPLSLRGVRQGVGGLRGGRQDPEPACRARGRAQRGCPDHGLRPALDNHRRPSGSSLIGSPTLDTFCVNNKRLPKCRKRAKLAKPNMGSSDK
eukprot:6264268-Pyramimonas_sp.AAC.1